MFATESELNEQPPFEDALLYLCFTHRERLALLVLKNALLYVYSYALLRERLALLVLYSYALLIYVWHARSALPMAGAFSES